MLCELLGGVGLVGAGGRWPCGLARRGTARFGVAGVGPVGAGGRCPAGRLGGVQLLRRGRGWSGRCGGSGWGVSSARRVRAVSVVPGGRALVLRGHPTPSPPSCGAPPHTGTPASTPTGPGRTPPSKPAGHRQAPRRDRAAHRRASPQGTGKHPDRHEPYTVEHPAGDGYPGRGTAPTPGYRIPPSKPAGHPAGGRRVAGPAGTPSKPAGHPRNARPAGIGTPLDRVLIAGIVSHLALAPGECQHSDRQVRHPRRRIDLVATSDS